MTNRKRWWGAALASLSACLAVACGITSEPGSGETHFLTYCKSSCGEGFSCACGVCTRSCESDAVCTDAAERATCLDAPSGCGEATKICDVSCASAGDCAAMGSAYACVGGVCRVPPPEPTCPSGCHPVQGYPEDPERHCALLEQPLDLGCQCTEAYGSFCRHRVSDGKLFVVPDGEFEDPSAWQQCDAEENTRFTSSCDFADCAIRPASFCTLEQTCADRGCDNLQYDESGCDKPECSDDSACAADERCVKLGGIDTSVCSPLDGSCGCGGPAIALPGAFCNPTAEVGPGGAWQGLLLTEDNGLCSPGSCYKSWNAMPDGSLVTQNAGVAGMVQLTPDELSTLVYLIDGPELRRDLRDRDCGTVEDGIVTLRLTLDGQVLERDVTGCVYFGDQNVFQQIYDFLQNY